MREHTEHFMEPRTRKWALAEMAFEDMSTREKREFLQAKLGCENEQPDRLLRRSEVSDRLAISLRSVDNLAAQGILTKVKLPRRRRAAGFRMSEVDALIREGGPA